MTMYNWISLFGVGSIVTAIYAYLGSKVKKTAAETKAVKLGIQALLRDRLYQLYNFCSAKKYADISERENFRNMRDQYHLLGANGVMDDICKKFFELPVERGED